jgi:Ca2+-binding EF-hand superfamily protein
MLHLVLVTLYVLILATSSASASPTVEADTNSDGMITKAEFRTFASLSGSKLTGDATDTIFSVIDQDGDGFASAREQKDFASRASTLLTGVGFVLKNIAQYFEEQTEEAALDIAQHGTSVLLDNKIDSVEFANFFRSVPPFDKLSSSAVDTIFSKLDTNDDGVIDQAEEIEVANMVKSLVGYVKTKYVHSDLVEESTQTVDHTGPYILGAAMIMAAAIVYQKPRATTQVAPLH